MLVWYILFHSFNLEALLLYISSVMVSIGISLDGLQILIVSFVLLVKWWFGLVGNVVGPITKVNQRTAGLVIGWVTTYRQVNLNQTPRSTQPSRPSVGQ